MEEQSESCSITGFEDGGRGPVAKERGQPLEVRKGKGTDSPLEPPEGM